MPVPAGQTTLVAPNSAPEYLAVGVGIQNYTCQSGVWTSVGAVASLYDISCFVNEPFFANIQQYAYELAPEISTLEAFNKNIKFPSPVEAVLTPILEHFFVPNPAAGGTGVDPRFNHVGSNDFSTLSKAASLSSPDGSNNVAWLHLSEVAGNLASSVFRVDTYLGQPPTGTCNSPVSKVLSVKYAAKYYFWK